MAGVVDILTLRQTPWKTRVAAHRVALAHRHDTRKLINGVANSRHILALGDPPVLGHAVHRAIEGERNIIDTHVKPRVDVER